MNIQVKQVSSLEKILPNGSIENYSEINKKTLLKGQSFSYQIAIETSHNAELKIELISPIKDYVNVYVVKNSICDMPTYFDTKDENFITKEPCLIPDVLMPFEDEGNVIRLNNESGSIWVNLNLSDDIPKGEYELTVNLSYATATEKFTASKTMKISVTDEKIPSQKTIFTQWFHTDSIADIHNVEIYSDAHWDLIDKYMSLAKNLGINMILTPVITPPLDTEVGKMRPCTQLVKIEKKNENYIFDFSLLKKWISLCKKNNIEYYEISHLFSQWGLKFAPNIKISENGKEYLMFGWHVKSDDEKYKEFLCQFLPSLVEFLKGENILDKCYFHISDEPSKEHIETYKYAHSIVSSYVDSSRIMDAISDYQFYETGLIKTPVTATNHIEEFLENDVQNQWAYYCCGQFEKVGNRFLAMPSHKNRILGIQMYKFGIKGFLQWGYNFYYSQLSRKKINPYITTSSDKAFPSGDPFSVYPTDNGCTPSLRAIIFKEALEDIEILRKLEEKIGRDEVIKMIDKEAKMDLTFKDYPTESSFIPQLIDKAIKMINKKTS
ncbi:MAG: DUF4091 domain-containing protein [Ruminococcaceae bacterium]|nr:DUF4091 domain-containing protein [Oscillospiraceae bacterium]